MQVRVFALVDMRQFVVYHTKESNDNFFDSHQVVLLFAMFSLVAQESHYLLSLATSTFQLATLVCTTIATGYINVQWAGAIPRWALM